MPVMQLSCGDGDGDSDSDGDCDVTLLLQCYLEVALIHRAIQPSVSECYRVLQIATGLPQGYHRSITGLLVTVTTL
jgi:hypothetical protein